MQNPQLNYLVLGFVLLVSFACIIFAWQQAQYCKERTAKCWGMCMIKSKLQEAYRGSRNYSFVEEWMRNESAGLYANQTELFREACVKWMANTTNKK